MEWWNFPFSYWNSHWLKSNSEKWATIWSMLSLVPSWRKARFPSNSSKRSAWLHLDPQNLAAGLEESFSHHPSKRGGNSTVSSLMNLSCTLVFSPFDLDRVITNKRRFCFFTMVEGQMLWFFGFSSDPRRWRSSWIFSSIISTGCPSLVG